MHPDFNQPTEAELEIESEPLREE
jgi:hypothetical protein